MHRLVQSRGGLHRLFLLVRQLYRSGAYLYDNAGTPDRSVAIHRQGRRCISPSKATSSRISNDKDWPVSIRGRRFLENQTHLHSAGLCYQGLTRFGGPVPEPCSVAGWPQHDLADRSDARRSRLRRVRRGFVRHPAEPDADRGHASLQCRQFAAGILRLSAGYEVPPDGHCFCFPLSVDNGPCTDLQRGRQGDRRNAQGEPDLADRRRPHGVRHLFDRLPSGRRQPPHRYSGRSRPTTRPTRSTITKSAGRQAGTTTACGSTGTSSGRTGTSSSFHSSGRIPSRSSTMSARRHRKVWRASSPGCRSTTSHSSGSGAYTDAHVDHALLRWRLRRPTPFRRRPARSCRSRRNGS